MDRSTLLSPWRILLGVLPLCYAGLLLIEIEHTFMWLGVIAAIIIVLLVAATSLDYPLLVCWPAFSCAILLCTCGIMLYQGVSDTSLVPVTHSSLEIWAVGLLAGIAMIWVVIRTRKLLEYV